MFSGIVEEMGRVRAVDRRPGGLGLRIEGPLAVTGTRIGDSISVAGVCLTVTELDGTVFAVDAVPETLLRTNLGLLEVGSAVNLERAVPAGRPLGGHYVQGHVDGTAEVTGVEADGEARNVTFRVDASLMPYLVPKGFVTLDGASLTLVTAKDGQFSVTLIPHTQAAVTLGTAAVGTKVNLEADVMAKYVERMLAGRLAQLEDRIADLEARRNGRLA